VGALPCLDVSEVLHGCNTARLAPDRVTAFPQRASKF